MEESMNRGMGAGMHPDMGATHDYALGVGPKGYPQQWDYARGVGEAPKRVIVKDEPPAPVPQPPSPGKMVVKHAKRSGFAIVGSYGMMAGFGLVVSAMSGRFGYLNPTILTMLVTLGPVFACAFKDYMHWMDSGDWDITEPEDEPSV